MAIAKELAGFGNYHSTKQLIIEDFIGIVRTKQGFTTTKPKGIRK